MPPRQQLLLLQLPRLDPDVTSPGENVMLAAACLQSALARSPEGRHWDALPPLSVQDTADNATLIRSILVQQPAVIGATLYLWNIERTLRLLAAIKQHLPAVTIVVGGPEVAHGHPLLFPLHPTVAAAGGRGNLARGGSGGPALPDRGHRPRLLHSLRLRAPASDNSPVDIAVIGEGEVVFPGILSALRRHARTHWRNVAWHDHNRFIFGTRPPPVHPLIDLLPPADHPILRPDAQGMAYLETNRGCPMRCAFCCYNLRRKGWSSLPPREVERRIRILRQRGTREIRFVDPTFNAHPHFRTLLGAMRRANSDRSIRFFVELRADTLTEQDAAQLAAANVVEAEVGVQSTDPEVLRCIHRPTRLERVLTGIERLQRHGIRPTIDFMYGLPRQGMDDIQRSLRVLESFPEAHQQFLPTLLLPGTELRDRAKELKLRAQPLPPYRVLSTDRLSAKQLAAIESLAQERLGGFDTPTRRFVGTKLPDLFKARVIPDGRARPPDAPVSVAASRGRGRQQHCGGSGGPALPGTANRRAIIFSGEDLFAQRQALAACIRKVVRLEPDILWQFVLEPEHEEPLDLLEFLTTTIRRLPAHWLDRLVSPPGKRRFVARRLFVRLPHGRAFDRGWKDAAESLLAESFH